MPNLFLFYALSWE